MKTSALTPAELTTSMSVHKLYNKLQPGLSKLQETDKGPDKWPLTSILYGSYRVDSTGSAAPPTRTIVAP